MSGDELDLNNFAGEWLKPEMVKTFPLVTAPVGAGVVELNGKKQPYLEIEQGSAKFKFRLNKTNINFLSNKGFNNLKEVVGKILKIEKMKVNNPQTKQAVDSFVIVDVKKE